MARRYASGPFAVHNFPDQASSTGGAVDSVNGATGAVTVQTTLVQDGALSGVKPSQFDLGLDRLTGTLYGPDGAGNWQALGGNPATIVNTQAELPVVTTVTAGTQATVTNDGANSGLYIATGAVGGNGTAWLKTGP